MKHKYTNTYTIYIYCCYKMNNSEQIKQTKKGQQNQRQENYEEKKKIKKKNYMKKESSFLTKNINTP